VLNDSLALRRCLDALKTQRDASVEIIVVDGANDDACRMLSQEYDAAYLKSERGRALQMNAGAAQARGEILWFLHADCTPAVESVKALKELDAKTAWGCFRHRIDAPGISLRLIECADNFRARWLRLPYGDQGMFVRRDAFERAGKFAAVPLLEDVLLARALRRESGPRVLRPVLNSDARRWVERGVLRTTLTNWKIMWLYFFGGRSPEELAQIYRGRSAERAQHA
jgi:rSAM/selenodomain-associated transferase 2